MYENYQTTAFEVHEWTLVVTAFFAVFIVGPLGLLLILLRSLRGVPQARLKHAATYLLGWGLILLLAYTDPTSFTGWFLD